MKEILVHIAMRTFLKKQGWTLIAGEYPGGSDDELYVLRIKDPKVAKDDSPDPRRHSLGEYVPDLFAYKNGVVLVIEAKPSYDLGDKTKLINLFSQHYDRLTSSVAKFCDEHKLLPDINFKNVKYIPTLAFENKNYKTMPEDKGFAHIYVKSENEAKIVYF